MFNKNIFRDKALEKLSAPEEFDIPLRIVNIRSWIFLVLLFAIIAAVFLWLSFSKINQEVNSKGIIVKEEHLNEVLAVRDGFIDEIFVKSADTIHRGDELLILISAGDKQVLSDAQNNPAAMSDLLFNEIKSRSSLRSPVNGVLFERIVSEGNYVRVGDKLLTLETETSSTLQNNFEVIGFIPGKIVNSIKEGTTVLISPKNVDVKEYGYLSGVIKRIAGYPVSQERLEMLEKKNPSLFGGIQDRIFEVTIVPRTDNDQLVWTSKKHPSIKLINGTSCDLKIIVSTKSIFSYIVQ